MVTFLIALAFINQRQPINDASGRRLQRTTYFGELRPIWDKLIFGGDPEFEGNHSTILVTKAFDRMVIHRDRSDVTGDYTLHNVGKSQWVTMSFPEGCSGYHKPSESLFRKFAVYVNGKLLRDSVALRKPGEQQWRIAHFQMPADGAVWVRQERVEPSNWLNLSWLDREFGGRKVDGQIITFSLSREIWATPNSSAQLVIEFAPDSEIKPNPAAYRFLPESAGSCRPFLQIESFLTDHNCFAFFGPFRPSIEGTRATFNKPKEGIKFEQPIGIFFVTKLTDQEWPSAPAPSTNRKTRECLAREDGPRIGAGPGASGPVLTTRGFVRARP